jgi:hypothetical protein
MAIGKSEGRALARSQAEIQSTKEILMRPASFHQHESGRIIHHVSFAATAACDSTSDCTRRIIHHAPRIPRLVVKNSTASAIVQSSHPVSP